MINKLREWAEGMKEKSSRDIGDFFNGYYVAMDDILTKLSELESNSIKEVEKYLEGKVKRGMAMGFREDFIWYEEVIAALSALKEDCEGEYLNYNPKDGLVTIDDWKKVAYSNAMKLDKLTAEVERLRGEFKKYAPYMFDDEDSLPPNPQP